MADGPHKSEGIRIALIGAAATIGAAVIAGLFGVLQSRPAQPVEAAPTVAPTAPPTTAPAAGLMFASRVAGDGEALDPGTTFPAGITDLYVVFPANAMPPGLAPFAERVNDGTLYAFFKATGSPALTSFGWRWLKDGVQINEFSANPQEAPFWLQRFDYTGKGVFGEWGPGEYTVVILLNGTPALSGELTVTAE